MKQLSDTLAFLSKANPYLPFSALCRVALRDPSNLHLAFSGKRSLSMPGARSLAEAMGVELVLDADGTFLKALPNVVYHLKLEISQLPELLQVMKSLQLRPGRWLIVYKADSEGLSDVAIVNRCASNHVAVQLIGQYHKDEFPSLQTELDKHGTSETKIVPVSSLRWVRLFNPSSTNHQYDRLFHELA